MSKPIGGRGNKADYETTHVRVPVPIKAEVQRLIERFHNGKVADSEKPLTSLDECVVIAREILKQKKSARVSLEKMLTAIYGEEIEL